jgi:hypothetical protein
MYKCVPSYPVTGAFKVQIIRITEALKAFWLARHTFIHFNSRALIIKQMVETF